MIAFYLFIYEQYIIKNNGIDTEKSYPYKAKDGACKFNSSSVGARIVSYVDVKKGDEKALQEAVANIGVISVAIDAAHESFQFYSSGIIDEPNCSSSNLCHTLAVVGYGTDDGKDYWLAKNSWGTQWGEQGYVRMSRNKHNQCGIASLASYPTV